MKGLVKKLSFVLIIIAIAIIAIFNQQIIKKIGNSLITDAETLRAASYEQVTEEDRKVEGTDNILFSAFFTRDLDGDGYAEKYKGTCTKIKTGEREELNKRLLYIDFNVLGDGKFKNGVITINNKNFKWKTTITADNVVEENYNGDVNTINLNDELLGGSQKLFSGAISPDIGNNINNYSQNSTITLTGIYVDDDENETPISKTVDLTVDWYGATKTVVNKDNVIQTKNINSLINNDKVKVEFDAIVTETEEELILQKQIAIIHLPELNGYKPTMAYTTHTRAVQNFDSETGELTISNNANTSSSGLVSVNIAKNNKYSIVAEYPLEAYTSAQDGTVSMDIQIEGYNYGYNNQNSEFSNPYISQNSNIVTVIYKDFSSEQSNGSSGTVVSPSTEKRVWNLDISVGNYIYSSETGGRSRVSKDSVIEKYNGNVYESLEDSYIVTWNARIGTPNLISKVILEEQNENEYRKSDKFLSSDNQYYSMRDYESITGIEITNASKILGIDGYIKVYNAENDTLIKTFNRQNWNNYSLLNVEGLKSIRIETSTPIAEGILSIKQTKTINDDRVVQDFTKEEFQKMRYIYSYVKGTIEPRNYGVLPSGTSLTKYTNNYAYYEEAVSRQSLEIEPEQILNQETENVKIKINTQSQNNFEKAWQNGVFLIEMPEDIIYAQVNNVTSSSTNVGIRDYSLYKENGKYYIKIYTDGYRELYTLTIDADITANPLKATKNEIIKLYAYNPNCNNYNNNTLDIYDVDGDSSTQDTVGYATTVLTTSAPSGLLTSEYLTNYDENGSITIAPNVAEIEKPDGARTVTVNVGIANNYSGTISEVSILGRFPYEGNKYILIDRDMKSEFTAYVTGPIEIPQSQKDNVIVYYSENGTANKDVNDENNVWKTAENVSDWRAIKSYLIDFGDYVFTQASNDTFTYEIEIPATVRYDEATFSNHAVFYTLETENGKLQIQTEPNRVGMQAVGIYNFKLSKNKLRNINTKVQGATYKVSCKDANGNVLSRILTTDVNGEILFEDIYIGREYILEEISCPDDYELSKEKIKFCASMDEQDNLVVNIINDEENNITGNFAEVPTADLDANGKYTVNARLEDESKYTITLNKTNENHESLSNVLFQFGEEGAKKTYSTDSNGRIVIRGLEVDKDYKIQEIKADGYYLDDSEKTFKVYRTEENVLKVYSDDEKYTNATIEYIDGVAQTQITLNVENEKIPTYTLQVFKNGENGESSILLQGAYFRLASADTGNNVEYVTDENGKIEVGGLYLKTDGKKISGEYTLQETRAPGGYINSAEEIVFSVEGTYNEQSQEYELSVNVENRDDLKTLKDIIIEDNTLVLIIKNNPLFKLTKVDSETGEVLSNVEFIIYKVNEDGTSDYAKDEYGNYVGTLNDNGDYIVTTDEYGVITLPLPKGLYCAVEVTYPNGYQEKEECDYFRVGNDEHDNETIQKRIVEINYIEDLVELSNNVRRGDNYTCATVNLMRSLDFENPDSYRSGEVDNNLIISCNKEGFIPIGYNTGYPFCGVFDGQGYEIKNLYIKTGYRERALFGCIKGAEIKNLTIDGIVDAGDTSTTEYINNTIPSLFIDGTDDPRIIGGIVAYAEDSTLHDLCNKCDISADIKKARSSGLVLATGGIVGYTHGNSNIYNCSNLGEIYGKCINTPSVHNGSFDTLYSTGDANGYVGGIAGCISGNSIYNCYNKGNVNSTVQLTSTGTSGASVHQYRGGIVGYALGNYIVNSCYNTGNVGTNGTKGGIVGYSKTITTVDNCYVLEGTGGTNLYSATECTEEYMKSAEFIEKLGSQNWEYDNERVNEGYPILSGEDILITEINYIEDLELLASQVNSGKNYSGCTIKLMRNLDFEDSSSYKSNTINDEYVKESQGIGFTPIGFGKETAFKGEFDGQGYEIKNLYVNSSYREYIGLFGYTDSANILNLGVSGEINCLREKSYTLLRSGSNEYLYAGGIVGYAKESNIEKCFNNVNVTGFNNVIDNNKTVQISNSTYLYIRVYCYVGGVVGYSNQSAISNSYNNGSILAKSKSTRYTANSYRRCSANSYAGGIVGGSNGDIVINTYNKGSISANASATDYTSNCAAGIIGYKEANCTLRNSYNVGTINNGAGIAVGTTSNKTSKCYSLVGSGSISGNVENRTEEQMKSAEFIQELGSRYWGQDEDNTNDGYPILLDSVENPITEINYIEDLVALSEEINNGEDYSGVSVKLMRNLDFADPDSYRKGTVNEEFIEVNEGIGFSPIGTYEAQSFKGSFDGQGHEIKNLYVSNSYAGLFGKIEDAEIKNLSVSGSIKGEAPYNYAGGIAAKAINSVVFNCENKGKITNNGYGDTGGIVGYAYNCEINECCNSGYITSRSDPEDKECDMGGIAGYIENTNVNNCNNSGEINGISNWAVRIKVGGIVGKTVGNSRINNCYNNGNVKGVITGGIVGYITSNGQVFYCYNAGNVSSSTTALYDFEDRETGGIAGRNEYIIKNCYNIGDVECLCTKQSDSIAGGIVGYNRYEIVDCYNMGDISANNTTSSYKSYAGGIAGKNSDTISNCYNIGDLSSHNTKNSSSAGAIAANSTGNIENAYYLDSINIDSDNKLEVGIARDSEYMKSKDFYRILNNNNVWLYRPNNYPILLNKSITSTIGETSEFSVSNTIKKYNITTDIKEIDNYRGGSISGEDEEPYEIVDYNKNNTKKIEIVPEEGYCIKNIKINDQAISYTAEDDGSYTIEENYFENMKENKHVVVEFIPKNNLIYIQKTDKHGNSLEGAEFKIESNNDTPIIGDLTNNGNYYFVENDGKYVSNNQAQSNTTASSYMKLDLTNYKGKYAVTVNAQVSSQSSYDYGYVTINNTSDAPAYNISTGRLVYISGTISSKDYTTEIEGGDIYYIHFGYYKNASTNTGNDCFTVNSIIVKPVVLTYTTTTNSSGIAMASVDYLGKYKISEIKAPEHYTINEEEKLIELTSSDSIQTVEYENTRKTEIVVHHYLDGTTSKVAADDIIEGSVGEHYDVIPHYDLDKLKIVENQVSYSGTFEEEGREYIIYYEPEQVKLTIHHYYDETENKLVEDKNIYTNATVEFTGEAKYNVLTNASYELKENEDYKNLINDNEFIAVISDIKANVSIDDILEYNMDSEISYYYKLKDVKYRVQYFYDGVLDQEKTEEYRELCGVTIESYEEKCFEGYMFDCVKALNENGEEIAMPLTLRNNEEYNVINVYYVTDESQTKEITYTVEYYKDGVRVNDDIEINKTTVQSLQNAVPVNKDVINTVDKYLGYKFERIDPEVIPDTATDGTIIRVYYVFDEDATKELSYRVEYYRNGIKVEEDTQNETIVVHVLEPNTLRVKKDEINTVDKYENCICTSTNPSTIPNRINNGSVIKVYYIDVQDYKFEKNWINKNEEDRSKYKTTYTLYKSINGTESVATNNYRTVTAIVNDDVSMNREVTYSLASTTITVTVMGNGTVEFKNLPRYNNGNQITYIVKETSIEKTTNNGISWATQSLSNYRINYNDDYEDIDRRVENTELFKITTEIAPNVSNERVGGTITGEFTAAYPERNGKRYVETVNESETPENDIVINPDEGYMITSITINGNKYEYTPDENGNVIIPKEHFQNIKENKHIIVSFINTNKVIKIIKEDEDGNRLSGAEFSISNKNDASSYIGAITADPDYEYCFEEMSDGSFASNNMGVDNSTARSYSEVDLSSLTDTYKLRVDVTISSESGYDSGYIEVEDAETGTINNLGYKSGSEQNIIVETILYGGKKYKVYYCYQKDSSAEAYDDRYYINSVSLEAGNEYTAITNEDGEALVEVNSDSAYNVKETVAPLGYAKSDEVKSVIAPNEVTFVNTPITHTITTEVGVNSSGERSGGTITGEYTADYPEENFIKFVEIVKEIQIATNDIVINPTKGYEVNKITINGENYTFEKDSNGTVVIPKSEFTNITSDKHIVVTFEEEEKEVTIIKTNKRSGKPLAGAQFRITSNFERTINVNNYISDMYNDPVYNQYSFDYDSSNGTYTSNNQNQDSTMAVGYKIIDLTTLEGEYNLIVNAEVSSESGYDCGYVTVDEISAETAQADISYDNLQNSYEMLNIDGEQSSQDYTTTLYGGKKYVIYFIYSKDGSEYNGTDTFKINSIGFENASGSIVVETDLTNIEGKTTFKIRGYGEYTISEIVTPDGYITTDDVTFELLASEDNPIINIQNERDGVIYATYTVNYFEKGTTTSLETSKTSDEVEVDSTIVAVDEVIDITGYQYDSAEVDSIIISEDSEENVINLYYTKRNDLSYTVNYLEKNTNNVLHTAKTEPNQTFGDEIASVNEKITIDGYNYDSVDPETLTIGAVSENNVINVYYTKRNDLSYTVNYLEKNTNNVLHTAKTAPNQTFGDEIASINEKITIDGYNYDSVDPETLTIGTVSENNVINVYYTKRNDLSYTVNYLEKNTNNVLHTAKTELNQTFGDVIRALDEVIAIYGYYYDSADKDSLTIGTEASENVINLYYTRADASVLVHYYIENTTTRVPSTTDGEEVADATLNGLVGDTYTTTQASNVSNKYELVSATPVRYTGEYTEDDITVIYYYRLKDTSVTAHYYIEGTNNKVPSNVEGEVVEDATIEGKVDDTYTTNPAGNVSSIYELVATPENATGTMTVESIDVYYYYKLKNYDYTVEYYYDNVINDTKTETSSETYGKQITEYTDKVITGYKFDKTENLPLTISDNTSNNVIKVYYVKRTDLSYTVNYLEKNTNNVLHTAKIEPNQTFGDVITAADEVITIYGYDYDSADKDSLTIGTEASENVINLYYAKKNAKVTAKYMLENTTTEIANPVEHTGKVGETYTTHPSEDIESKYELISATPEGYTGTYTEDDITVIYYYRLKDTQVIVHHYIQNNDGTLTTTKVPSNVDGKVVEDVVISGKVDDGYTTSAATNLHNSYELVITPEKATGIMTEDQIEIAYYYALKDAKAVARYVDLYAQLVKPDDTDEIAERQTKTGKVGDAYTTDQKTIEGYTFIRDTNNTSGTLTVEDIDVVYYYAPNTYVKVRYLEKGTNEVLMPEKTINGFAGKDYATDEETIENYTLVEVAGTANGTMTVNPITVTYYYSQNTKARVEYIDKADGRVMDSIEKTGLVGDEFATEAKEFENYILVESPNATTVNMTKDVITLKYYYAYANASLIVRHINVITGAVIESSIENGKVEGETYETTAKDIEGYDLVGEYNGHDYTPQNARGTYTKETITVDYYYIRKTSVTAKYIDKATGEALTKDVVINGHENDPYQTNEKTISGYALDSVDGDKTGTMTITTDSEGNVVTNKEVVYYYKKASTVKVNHIDISTDEVLIAEIKNGYEGDNYSTTAKSIEGYDLVETRLPENKDGIFTRDEQTVNYYYIPRLTVKVIYQDEAGTELDQDHIEGHEGDAYTTVEKKFKGYEIAEVPNNAEGTMVITKDENGNRNTEIIVIYKYKKLIPKDVIEKYIDINTDETVKEVIHKGELGEVYSIKPKTIPGYTLLTEDENGNSLLPTNTTGKYTTEKVEVVFYVIKNASVRVQHINLITGEKMADDVIIEGYEGRGYTTEALTFEGYELTGIPENARGKMKVTIDENGNKVSEIVVKYYYAEKLDGRLPKTNESNTKQAILIAIPFVVLVNLCLCAKTFEKSKKGKDKEMRKNKKEAKAEELDK